MGIKKKKKKTWVDFVCLQSRSRNQINVRVTLPQNALVLLSFAYFVSNMSKKKSKVLINFQRYNDEAMCNVKKLYPAKAAVQEV